MNINPDTLVNIALILTLLMAVGALIYAFKK